MSRFDGRRFPFLACGEDVTIYEWVRVLAPEGIDVGDHVIVDDFAFLDGKGGLRIGSHVHIASYVSVAGGGEAILGDFSGLAAGSRLITGTDLMDGSGLTGPTIPADLRAVRRGRVTIGRHVVVGSNAVVHTDVTIGDGAIIGSGSVVTRDVPPWTIAMGAPARPVRARPSETVLAWERELLARGG
jgi:acetyltransferase-like isoleucine patch superfamily enzyme